jgi:hypothetical protein
MGGRRFQCLDCASDGLARSPDIAKDPAGELHPLK